MIQSVLCNSVEKIIRTIKSKRAKDLFKRFPEIEIKILGIIFGQVFIMQIQLVNMQFKKQLEICKKSR